MRDGFFAPERGDGFAFAWIGARATLRLGAAASTRLAVEAATPAAGQTLTVRTSGGVVARFSLEPGAWRRHLADAPLDGGREHDLTLEVSPLLGAEHKGADPRPLGAMVRRVAFDGAAD